MAEGTTCVNFSSMDKAADIIHDTICTMNWNRSDMNDSINALTNSKSDSWKGEAAQQYHVAWRRANSQESDFYKFRDELEHYERFIRYAKKRYEECIYEADNLTSNL